MARRPDRKQSLHITLTSAGAVAVLLAMTLGCAVDRERLLPKDRTWESEHFRYHSRNSDDSVCVAILEQLERHFEITQSYLGFSWPKDRKVDYYKFLDEADYVSNSGCPDASAGCAPGSTVMSCVTLQEHELVHAYLAPLGFPPRAFVEGIAMVLACDVPIVTLLGDIAPWKQVVTLPPKSNGAGVFIEAQWFVGYLLYRYGPERFLSLYEHLDDELASAEQIASTFELVYGETLDIVWNAALASSHRVRCVNNWQCSGSALPLDGSIQTIAQACDGSDKVRTFELSTETDVIISSGNYSIFAPVSCGEELPDVLGGNTDGVAANGIVYSPAIMPVPAGKYFINRFAGSSATVGVRALPLKVYSQDCTQLEPIDLGGSEFTPWDFELSIPNDGRSWFVKVHPPSDRSVAWRRLAASTEVEQCLNCIAPYTCQSLEGGVAIQPDTDGNVTLRLTSATPSSGNATYKFILK